MRIAVTGANGFVGRHVVAELARRDIDTISVFRTGANKIDPGPPGTTVSMDLHSLPSNSYEVMGEPDVLIHLAWGGLPNYGSLHHFERELPVQYRFLKAMIEAGLESVLVAGTCFEYGMANGQLHEGMVPSPANPYGFAKDALRRELEFLKGIHPFSLTWARLFYVYGEGQARSSLYSQLLSAIEQGALEFDMSDGQQLRDYLHVSKVAEYLVSLALSKQDVGPINVCSGRPISVRALVEGWLAANNWNVRLNLGRRPPPTHEPLAFWGDREKLNQVLGRST